MDKVIGDDLIAALREIRSAGETADGATVADLADKLGLSVPTIRARLRGLVTQGLVESVWCRRPSMSGVMGNRPAYRMVKQQAAPAKRKRGRGKK